MTPMNRKTIVLQWLQIVAGLLVFAFGVHLTIFANIGLAPGTAWEWESPSIRR